MRFQQNWSAEHRLDASRPIFPHAETVLGVPVAPFHSDFGFL